MTFHTLCNTSWRNKECEVIWVMPARHTGIKELKQWIPRWLSILAGIILITSTVWRTKALRSRFYQLLTFHPEHGTSLFYTEFPDLHPEIYLTPISQFPCENEMRKNIYITYFIQYQVQINQCSYFYYHQFLQQYCKILLSSFYN